MNIVIPYIASGSELKYALRGIEKHYSGAEVFIIGDKPEGFQFINHIKADDTPGLFFKERNIFNKVLLASEYLPEFLFMNDDHFLLEPVTENYYEGTLKQWLDRSQPNSYQQTLKNTFTAIGDVPYYDIHCPMIMKREILEVISCFNWGKAFGFCFKSLYGYCMQMSTASIKMRGIEYPDLKFREWRITRKEILDAIAGRKFFSTGNQAMHSIMIGVLEELYPEKSHFEK